MKLPYFEDGRQLVSIIYDCVTGMHHSSLSIRVSNANFQLTTKRYHVQTTSIATLVEAIFLSTPAPWFIRTQANYSSNGQGCSPIGSCPKPVLASTTTQSVFWDSLNKLQHMLKSSSVVVLMLVLQRTAD